MNGQQDLNRWSNYDERVFLQEFLSFYNTEVLRPTESFHYETFYDYYSGYLTKNENKEIIEGFYVDFRDKHLSNFNNHKGCRDRVSDFNRNFNQLIASLLYKTEYFENVGFSHHPPYESFIMFLVEILKTCDVKFHTLNHDLFFDWLGKHHSDLFQHFTDGFQLAGSPYYGKVSYDFNNGSNNRVHKTYYVKLEQFTDKFNKPLALYKLHGSIFTKIVYTPHSNQGVRVKDDYAVNEYYVEITDPKTGEHNLEFLFDAVAPDFLSGTTNKIRYYTNDPYYKNLFNHFENNLTKSNLLIVIGYGFQDIGINEYLEKFFLSKGNRMVVIDPRKPDTELIEKYAALYIPKGITELTYNQYLDLVLSELKSKEE